MSDTATIRRDNPELKLENQLCFPLYLCSKELTKKYIPYLKELNLTYTQYVVMLCLWRKDAVNISSLCNILMLETNTLTPLLQKLEQKGFIERRRSDEDAREMIIHLTQKGEKLYEKALVVPHKIGDCIDLQPEEAMQLHKILYKLIINFRRQNENN